ncbi:AzlC family ABC transporter permease [Nocardioidaceae bacterium]|nr:AzlC family ABC transporter permease [Nocardioidaceae bacterium]
MGAGVGLPGAVTPSTDRALVRDCLAVAIATGLYGTSFGAVAVASGLSVAQTCALSLLAFTGASQFAFIGVVATGGTPVAAAATAVLLGTRNALYGLRMAPSLAWTGWRRAAAAHVLIDESTAMAFGHPDRRRVRLAYLVTGIGVLVLWNLMTLVGALAGDALGDPRTYGLDGAVVGAFAALLWPRLDAWLPRLVALGAAAVAVGLVPVTPAGLPVLVAGLVAVVAGVLRPATRQDRRGGEPL